VLALDAVTALYTADGDDRPLRPAGWALLIVSSAVLLWRHRFPVAVLAVTAAATLAYYPLGFPDTPIVLSLAIALHSVARDRGWAVSAAVAVVLAVLLSATGDEPLQVAIGVVPILLLPVVLGEVARQAEQRAALAEAALESEALRRTAEERLRIARELHDVLAHQISLINVQAGAALHTREPDQAWGALRAVRAASGEALTEIRSVLGVLRDPGQPDLAALPELLSRTEATGLTVRARIDLPPPAPPPAVQLAAYRIVQEALTNVVRHSSATAAEVHIQRTSTALEITVDDDGDAVPQIEHGNGMRGMGERAAAVGGEFEAGPRASGGFRVQARLPVTLNDHGTR
jgi:signal transduction histidine kinase